MLERLGLNLPKEHGAWAMLYVPFALGALAAARIAAALLWALLAMTALFFARETLRRLRRARQRRQPQARHGRGLVLVLGLAGGCGAILVWVHNLWGFIPMGILALLLLLLNLEQTQQRQERSVQAELLAIVGFAMAAPAAHYAALGAWRSQALWLWLLSWLYFASSVFHVKTQVLSVQAWRRQAFLRMRRLSLAYHGGMLGLTGLLAATGTVPPLVLLGFVPLWVRTAWSLVRPAARLELKRIGVLEIVYSLGFLLFGSLAFRGV